MTRLRPIAVGLVLAFVFGSCGATSGSITDPGLGMVKGDVTAVHVAATAQDRAATTGAVNQLRADVARLRATNQLSAGRAAAILAAAGEVDASLATLPSPTIPPATTTTSTTSPPPGQSGKHGHGNGGGDNEGN
ncbi:MAG: hypothetical protein M3063_17390 [Actinomycetota bacterium]|nr:hypothetical protein [Actinomycetota bacterium]MDQ6945657.1 hypothetical protein [Actinomycetota bacterium]